MRAASPAREWLSEEEMPDRNVDGTLMVNGVDLNGRPYLRNAAWEEDAWQARAHHAAGVVDSFDASDLGASRASASESNP